MDFKLILDRFSSITKEKERNEYFEKNIKSVILSIYNYYLVKYGLTNEYEKEEILSCVYVGFFTFMNKYNNYTITNHLSYTYSLVNNEFRKYLRYRNGLKLEN